MTCGLSKDEIDFLYVLYSHHNISSSHSQNLELLKRMFAKRVGFDAKEVVKNLSNGGYITKVSKKDDKYYISDIKKAIHALSEHGKETTLGRNRPI
jgi:hypothetical protein